MLGQRLVDTELAVQRFGHELTTITPRARLIVEDALGIRRRTLPAMITRDTFRNVLVGTQHKIIMRKMLQTRQLANLNSSNLAIALHANTAISGRAARKPQLLRPTNTSLVLRVAEKLWFAKSLNSAHNMVTGTVLSQSSADIRIALANVFVAMRAPLAFVDAVDAVQKAQKGKLLRASASNGHLLFADRMSRRSVGAKESSIAQAPLIGADASFGNTLANVIDTLSAIRTVGIGEAVVARKAGGTPALSLRTVRAGSHVERLAVAQHVVCDARQANRVHHANAFVEFLKVSLAGHGGSAVQLFAIDE